MSEAFVYDAIRTPRGKGKKDGSLHEVKPINLLTGLLTELQRAGRGGEASCPALAGAGAKVRRCIKDRVAE